MASSTATDLRSLPRETKIVVGLISGSELLNHMYLMLFPPILAILAGDFEAGLFLMGIAMGAQGVSNTAFQMPFGYLSDNYDRSLVLGFSLGLGTLGVLIVALAPSYPVLVLGQVIVGLGVAGHHPVHYPLLSNAVPTDILGRVYSVRGFAGWIGFAVTPALMTAIVGFGSFSWRHAVALIGVVGVAYTAVTIVGLRRFLDPADGDDRVADRKSRSQSASVVTRVRKQLRSLRASPAILLLAVVAFGGSMSGWGVRTYTVVLLTDGYELSLNLANLTLTAMLTGGALMTLVGGGLSDRFAPGPVIVGSFVGVSLLVVVFGSLAIPAVAAIGVALVLGGVRSIGGPARSKLTDAFSSQQNLGMNFAVITVGTMAGSAVAPPLFGALIEYASVRTTFFLIAGFTLLAALATVAVLYYYGDRNQSADITPARSGG